MAEKNLSRVQKMILEVFDPVYKYMIDNGIEYYMLGGTLLGAIRHKGFIPWDDDIDIGVPREDYEKLLKNIQKELPKHLRLDTFRNSKTHHYYFARIVDTRYSLKRLGSEEERDENVWIDIFPLDGMPDNPVIRRIHMMRLLYTRAMYHISCFEKVNLKRPNRPLSERIVIKFVQITGFGRHGDMHKRLEKLDKLMKEYSIKNTGYVSNFMGQYKFKEMFPKSYYGHGTLYDFEDYKLMGPDNYDAVLTQMYGDYMTPPKDADKNAHAAVLNDDKEG